MIERFNKIIYQKRHLQNTITKLLDLDVPFPKSLLERVILDDVFASLICKASVEKELIPIILKSDTSEEKKGNNYSNFELVKNRVESLIKWLKISS